METKSSSENVSRLGKGKDQNNQNIQVFVRVRPMNSMELNKHSLEVVDTPGTTSVVVRERSVGTLPRTFSFDRVFGPKSRQVDVYKAVVAPLVSEVLLGYNCTVFAYGQTGTGKTFTMEGSRSSAEKTNVEDEPLSGILPRALSHLFDEVRMMNCEFTMRVSFLELYNEELFDLLAPIEENRPRTLRLFDDVQKKGSVIVHGLEEVIVQNKHEVYAVLERGSQQRKTAATLMNATSSRSHTVFTITVHMRECSMDGEEMVKIGKLYLVDLAGSENIGKSGAVDKRAREAGNINMSLLTLGRVITSLVEHTPHVPYRESKLTRLLQDSLGGKTKTSIIATISPAATNIEETLSTLDYAFRARHIQNRPEVNQRLTKKEALNIYTEEIERLRRDLTAAREKTGFFMAMENYKKMTDQIDSQHRELNEKSNKIRELEEALALREDELQAAADTNAELRMDLSAKQAILEETVSRKLILEKKWLMAENKIDELKHLLDYHRQTEKKMNNEASSLLSTTTDTVSMIEILHARLERKQMVQDRNWLMAQRFRADFRKSIDELISCVSSMKDANMISTSQLRGMLQDGSVRRRNMVDKFMKSFNEGFEELRQVGDIIQEVYLKHNNSATSAFKTTQEVLEVQSKTALESIESLGTMTCDKTNDCKIMITNVRCEALDLQKKLEVDFEAMSEYLLNYMLEFNERYDSLEKTLVDLEGVWQGCMDQLTLKFNELQDRQVRFREDQLAKIQMMETNLESLKQETMLTTNATIDSFGYFRDTTSNANKLCKLISGEGKDCSMDGRTAVETAMLKLPGFREDIVSKPGKVMEGMVAKLSSAAKDVHDAQKMVAKSTKEVSSTMTAFTESHAKCSNKVQDKLKQMGTTLTAVTSEHVQALKDVQEGCYNNFSNINTEVDGLCGDILKRLDYNCDFTTESANDVNSALHKAAGNVDEFWEETYLTDTPSGATPCRKKYEFPTKLSYPSPQERVLQRYKLFSKDLQEAIDECAERDTDSSEDPAGVKLAVSPNIPIDVEEVSTSCSTDSAGEDVVFSDENLDPNRFALPRRLDTINESSETSKVSLDETKLSQSSEPMRPSSACSAKSVRSDSGSSNKETPLKKGTDKGKSQTQAAAATGGGRGKNSRQRRKNVNKGNVLKAPNK